MSSENDKRKELFSDMPLPDMNKSWELMKKKLQEDKDRRKPLFYWPLRGGVLLLILLFLGAGAGWWFLADRNNNQPEKNSAATTSNQLPVNVSPQNDPAAKTNVPGAETATITPNNPSNTNDINLPAGNTIANTKNLRDKKRSDLAAPPTNAVATPILRPAQKNLTSRTPNNLNSKKSETRTITGNAKAKSRTRIKPSSAEEDKSVATTTPTPTKEESFTTDSTVNISTAKTNSPLTLTPDTATKKTEPTTPATAAKPNQPKTKKSLQFSLGLGLQQQVPIGGQSGTGYNYYGRSNTFSDHLPSLYIRMEKEKKWFVDAEFHYGSPQLLKSFSYNRKTSLQNSGTVLSTSSLNIEKTYYHRIPISLNIYLKPRWSVGAGMEYSHFYGAISRKTVTNKNLLSGVTGSSSEMIFVKQFNDSFLYKSQVRLFLQTMYQWKRFSFGLRYSADLEPYIRFTTPEGEIRDKRSSAVQVLMRYRMFRK